MELTKEWLLEHGFKPLTYEEQKTFFYTYEVTESHIIEISEDMKLGQWCIEDDFETFNLEDEKELPAFTSYVEGYLKIGAHKAVQEIVNFLDCISYNTPVHSIQRIIDILIANGFGHVDELGYFNKN